MSDSSPSPTLLRRLRARAQNTPDARLFIYLRDGEHEESLTAAALDLRARALGAALQKSIAPGDRVVVAFPTGLDFITAYFGALYAGAVPVPAESPATAGTDTNGSLVKIVEDCQPVVLASDAAGLEVWERDYTQVARFSEIALLDPAEVDDDDAEEWKEPAMAEDDLAAVLYSCYSGPARGLPMTHAQLAFFADVTKSAFGLGEKLVFMGFLHLHFDFGFQTQVVLPLYYEDGQSVFMSPGTFAEPTRWFRTVSRYHANASGANIDAVMRCGKRLEAAELRGLDLSSWKAAVITNAYFHRTELDDFARLLAPAGFAPAALRPIYATAEATSIVTARAPGTELTVLTVDRRELQAGRVVPAAATHADVSTLVSQGVPVRDTVVKIVEPETGEVLADDEIGEIWVRGPGVVGRYWTDEAESVRCFQARLAPDDGHAYLRTGDFGFLHQAQLYVLEHWMRHTFIGPRTVTDEQIESVSRDSHPSLLERPAAAFFLNYQRKHRGYVVQEAPAGLPPETLGELARRIQERLKFEFQYEPEKIFLVRPGFIQVDAAGRPARYRCRRQFMERCLKDS